MLVLQGSGCQAVLRSVWGEETCWGFTPGAAKLGGLGFVFSEGAAELHISVRKFSAGLYPIIAGNKNHDLQLRQEGIKGINLRFALSFLYRLH